VYDIVDRNLKVRKQTQVAMKKEVSMIAADGRQVKEALGT